MIIEDILKETEVSGISKYEVLHGYINALHKVYMNEVIKYSGASNDDLFLKAWELYKENNKYRKVFK